MSKIKTRETVKDIKILDKSADVSRHMKDAFIRAKDTAENLSDDGQVSPSEYAEDKIKYAADDVAHDAGHAVSSGTKKAVNRGKDAYRQHREAKNAERAAEQPVSESRTASPRPTASQPQRAARQSAERNIRTTRQTRNQTIKTSRQTERTIKQTARSAEKATVKTAQGSVKTTQKTVKTAEQTSKAAIKTAQATAKATQKSAQASAKAAQKAAQAARATAKAAVVTAKAVAKATVAAVKAIIAAVKELVVAIAAGGWVAVVAIEIICLIGLIVGSCFGIFFSSEDTGGQPMTEVVREINTDYETRLDETNDSQFIERLGKVTCSLRLDDWNAKTIPLFLEYIVRFKETVDSFNQQNNNTAVSSDEYRITFIDDTGKEITKSFAKVNYYPRAKLLLNEVATAIDEMGESITEQEKRQVLIEMLENLL